MADGSRTSVLEAEAQTAAAEAAREAKAEVLERTSPPVVPGKRKGRLARALSRKEEWHHFVVDVWITSLNSIEFGIYKHSRNRAKSRQFTTDMDVFAEVVENGERTGVLGYREDLWHKSTGMDKRLVFKLFGEKLNWHATMDLMIGRSLQQTLGARGLPVTAFAINVSGHEQMVQLERSANKWPFLPENFAFFLIEDDRSRFYRLKRDLIDLGGDYTLYDEHDRAVGALDGKVFSIGGKWKGKILREHADTRLLMILKLFCGMLIFNKDCCRHMRQLAREVRAGKYATKLEKQEADLYMNPRRVR